MEQMFTVYQKPVWTAHLCILLWRNEFVDRAQLGWNSRRRPSCR